MPIASWSPIASLRGLGRRWAWRAISDGLLVFALASAGLAAVIAIYGVIALYLAGVWAAAITSALAAVAAAALAGLLRLKTGRLAAPDPPSAGLSAHHLSALREDPRFRTGVKIGLLVLLALAEGWTARTLDRRRKTASASEGLPRRHR